MYSFAFNSYKSEQDRRLLDTLREAIFVLKLEAQNQLAQNSLSKHDVDEKRLQLIEFLFQLDNTVTFLHQENASKDFDLAFIGFANRFIQVNPHDVEDRIDEIRGVSTKTKMGIELSERDFRLLDRLQLYLEEEIAKNTQGLFRL